MSAEPERGEHAIEAIRPLGDVLEGEDGAVGDGEATAGGHRREEREVAADERTARSAGDRAWMSSRSFHGAQRAGPRARR